MKSHILQECTFSTRHAPQTVKAKEMSGKIRANRMWSAEDVDPWIPVIGKSIGEYVARSLHAEMDTWIFSSAQEVDSCSDLMPEEKEKAKIAIANDGVGFTVWRRQKFSGGALSRRVFTEEHGGTEVRFRWSGNHCAAYVPIQTYGWREHPDGSRERVAYRIGEGWVRSL